MRDVPKYHGQPEAAGLASLLWIDRCAVMPRGVCGPPAPLRVSASVMRDIRAFADYSDDFWLDDCETPSVLLGVPVEVTA